MSWRKVVSSSWAVLRSVGSTLLIFLGVMALMAVFMSGSPLSGTAPTLAAQSLDGERVELAQYRGKPVVLYFWATWCTACKMTSPTVDGFAERRPDVPVLAVAMDDAATVRGYLEGQQRHFVVLADGDAIARGLGIRAYPTTAILDAEGRVHWSRQGVLMPGELDLRLP